jgi:hypothetical protein
MQLLNLPVDVWFAIMQHLPLPDLTALHTAFASYPTPVDLSVIERCAVNVISRMLALDKCKPRLVFSDNGPCYKFRMTDQRGKCSHRDDHGSNPPCGGGWYDPVFSHTMEFSRTFRSHPHDMTITDMTIFANDGKPFHARCTLPVFPDLGNTGPTELISAQINFHTSSTKILRFIVNTFEANIEETFSDVPHSPTCVFRTVAHNVPLKKVEWVEWVEETQNWKYTDLPKEWYEFWSASGIWGVSTFSKELITFTHYKSGEVVHQWEWKMASFKIEWKLPMPMSSGLFLSRSLH